MFDVPLVIMMTDDEKIIFGGGKATYDGEDARLYSLEETLRTSWQWDST